MDENTTHRRPFEDKIPEDVRQHARAARAERRSRIDVGTAPRSPMSGGGLCRSRPRSRP